MAASICLARKWGAPLALCLITTISTFMLKILLTVSNKVSPFDTEEAEAEKLKKDSIILQEAGCFGIVLEKIPALLAKEVSSQLSIPTIGIGAGGACDGQVLVMHDMLGINVDFKPRFLRRYLNLHEQIDGAVKQYISDIKSKDFPNENEQY